MSWETQSWAGRQRPGFSSGKLVLLGLASCADANHQAHPSVEWLCQFSDLNRKTVISALDRLAEARLIADTGQRRGRTMQVKVYRLEVTLPGDAKVGSDPASETVPKTEQYRKRNSTVSCRKESQKRDTEPFLGTYPPSPSNDGEAPSEKIDDGDEALPAGVELAAPKVTVKPHALPPDWTPPPVTALSAAVQARLREWPAGAFEAVCETFRLHWLSETRAIGRKSNWNAALGKWLLNDHSKVMRDAKFGVSFTAFVPASAGKAATPPSPPTPAKARENQWSQALHAMLKRAQGETVWASRFAPCALLLSDETGSDIGLTLIAPSEFQRGYLEANLSEPLRKAVQAVTGALPGWIRFEVERPKETAHA